MDIETDGQVRGVNPGDSKLLGLKVRLVSHGDLVSARRVKADEADFSGRGVQITSSMEAAHLNCQAGEDGFLVQKRLGLGRKGRVDSTGKIKIGSVFSMMR